MDKITKLPWKLEYENSIEGADGDIVLDCIKKEDAEYICLAVNSHEGLVEALRQAKTELESFNYLNTDKNILTTSTTYIDIALEAADGEGVK
jgi:hypothetical protein